ncbi:MAG: penicillin-binding protein [Calditrichia bacterium]
MKRKSKKNPNRYFSQPSGENRANFRLIFLTMVLVACFLVIGVKLFILQVLRHDYYLSEAEKNTLKRIPIPARRGAIYDRKGRELAKDIIQYSVAIRAKYAKNKDELVRKVAQALKISPKSILSSMQRSPNFAYVAHRISSDLAESLLLIRDPGLILERRLLRVYPYKENGAHFLGYCDVENKPLGGIEYQYNAFLQGKPGWKIYLRDAIGNQVPNLDYAGEDPLDGLDVVLTIDIDYQLILEEELKNAIESHRARDGAAILMDPHSGEILAMANYPRFDPNFPNKYEAENRKNRVISNIVEPGSTFKFAVLSTALENLNVDLDRDIYFCENGRFKLADHVVVDHKPYGWLTLRKVIENSSNIGTMKLMEKLNKRVFFKYVRNFGFGMVTGIDLPGESHGILHPLKNFSSTTHYFMSIGYEIGVTPLQLVNAYAVIANGGNLLRPYIMKAVYDHRKKIVAENKPEVIRKVISKETTDLINSVLQGVVKEGTGTLANIEQVPIAGKTGTAQLYNPETGQHDPSKHLASFVGFFPAHNPQFVLLVMISQPRGVYYGGSVAAPVFREMAQRIYSLASVEPLDLTEESIPSGNREAEFLPDVENMNVEVAQKILENHGIPVEVVGSGLNVLRQQKVQIGEEIAGIRLYTETPIKKESVMPSLKGLSIKESLSILGSYNVNTSIEGHGVVIEQYPKPGTKIAESSVIKLVCNPS